MLWFHCSQNVAVDSHYQSFTENKKQKSTRHPIAHPMRVRYGISFVGSKSTFFPASVMFSGLILGLRPANERRRYKVTPSLIGWAQT